MSRLFRVRTVVMSGLIVASALPILASNIATPAAADPVTIPAIAGVGGPQSEELLDAILQAINPTSPAFGDYSAEGGSTVQTAPTGCVVNRPRTTQQALDALTASTQNQDGCIDFARYAADPAPDQISMQSSAALTHLPYAQDLITYAVTTWTTVPRQMSLTRMRSIYHCESSDPYVPALPPVGSEIRAKWIDLMGMDEADITAGAYPCLYQVASENPYAPNVGIMLGSNMMMPISVAHWAGGIELKGVNRFYGIDPGNLLIDGDDGDSSDGTGPLKANTTAYADPMHLTVAVSRDTTLTPDMSFSLARLRSIYSCQDTSARPLLPYGITAAPFMQMLGLSMSDVSAGHYPCIVREDATGDSLYDNNASEMDPHSVMPFQIQSYLDQTTGHVGDTRFGSLLAEISDGGGNRLPLIPNPNYGEKFKSWVSNVFPTASLAEPDLDSLFVGPDAAICQHSDIVAAFGYLTVGDECGGGTAAVDALRPAAPSAPAGTNQVVNCGTKGECSGTYIEAQQRNCWARARYEQTGSMLIFDGALLQRAGNARCAVTINIIFHNYEHRSDTTLAHTWTNYGPGDHDWLTLGRWIDNIKGGYYLLKSGNMVQTLTLKAVDLDANAPLGVNASAIGPEPNWQNDAWDATTKHIRNQGFDAAGWTSYKKSTWTTAVVNYATRQCLAYVAGAVGLRHDIFNDCERLPIFFPSAPNQQASAVISGGMNANFLGQNIYTTDGQNHPEWVKLTASSRPDRNNWPGQVAPQCGPPWPAGTQCQEYPFYSTVEGGQYPVALGLVDSTQNMSEGAFLVSFRSKCGIMPGDKFLVVPLVEDPGFPLPETGWICRKP